MDLIIGVDFGTTNSCLSYYNTNNSNVTVIPNEQGNFTTPSILFLNNESSEILFGESALQLLRSNNNQLYLSNIFSNLKRLIGNINLTDNLKEKWFFIINRYLSKIYPEKSFLLNDKSGTSTPCFKL